MISEEQANQVAELLDQVAEICGDGADSRLLIVGDSVVEGVAICIAPRAQSPAVTVELLLNSAQQIMTMFPQLRVQMRNTDTPSVMPEAS